MSCCLITCGSRGRLCNANSGLYNCFNHVWLRTLGLEGTICVSEVAGIGPCVLWTLSEREILDWGVHWNSTDVGLRSTWFQYITLPVDSSTVYPLSVLSSTCSTVQIFERWSSTAAVLPVGISSKVWLLLSWCNFLFNHLLVRSSSTPSPQLVWLKIGQSPLNYLLSRLDGDGVFSSSGVQIYSKKPKCHGVPVSWHFFMMFFYSSNTTFSRHWLMVIWTTKGEWYAKIWTEWSKVNRSEIRTLVTPDLVRYSVFCKHF